MIALLESLWNVLAIPASPYSPYAARLTPRRDVHVYTMTFHDIQLYNGNRIMVIAASLNDLLLR